MAKVDLNEQNGLKSITENLKNIMNQRVLLSDDLLLATGTFSKAVSYFLDELEKQEDQRLRTKEENIEWLEKQRVSYYDEIAGSLKTWQNF